MQGTGPQVSVGEILSAWSASLGRHASVCLLAGGVIAAGGTMLDLAVDEGPSTLIGGIAGFFVQYHVVEYVLIRDFGVQPGKRRYGSAFASSVLATIAILGGMALLVLPGLYLMARWSISNPLIIGEESTSIGALKESWHRTEASAWALVGCHLIVGLGVLATGLAVAGLGYGSILQGVFAVSLIGNLLGAVISISYSVLGCALYGLIAKPEGKLDDVFS